jgi:hypothetical protein
MTYKRLLPLLILLFSTAVASYAQDEDIFGISERAENPKSHSGAGNALRNVMEMFALELSTGAAYQQMNTKFYSPDPTLYPISQIGTIDSSPYTLRDTLSLFGGDRVFPLFNGGVRVNLFNLLTVGAGYGLEWGNLAPMRGNDHEFQFEGATYQISKSYWTVGLVLYDAKRRQSFLNWRYKKYSSNNLYMQSELRQRIRQNYPWRFILEAEFGKLNLKKSFDPTLNNSSTPYVPRLAVAEDPYMGISMRVEYDFSEYAKAFIKGGADFRKFTYAAADFSEFQNIDQNVYALQAGMALKLPGTKRCKITGCGVVMKHMHDGVEYRGSSIFRLQNRKIGQWY